jgi:hypothetical protein
MSSTQVNFFQSAQHLQSSASKKGLGQ